MMFKIRMPELVVFGIIGRIVDPTFVSLDDMLTHSFIVASQLTPILVSSVVFARLRAMTRPISLTLNILEKLKVIVDSILLLLASLEALLV